MKKSLFFLIISSPFWGLGGLAQVSQSPDQLYIGKVASGSPPANSVLVSVANANEIARFQGTPYPQFSFYSPGGVQLNAVIGALMNAAVPFGFYFATDNGIQLKIGNNFTIDPNAATCVANHQLILAQGMSVNQDLAVGNGSGSTGQILTSRGSVLSPVWSTIHDDPKVGFTSYIDYALTLPHNEYIDLNNFTVINENNPLGGDIFNEGTGQFTVPSAGLYHFHLIVSGINTTEIQGLFTLYLSKNGALTRSILKNIGVYGGSFSYIGEAHFRQSLFLNQGDNVMFTLRQTNSGSSGITITPTPTFKRIRLSAYQVYNY